LESVTTLLVRVAVPLVVREAVPELVLPLVFVTVVPMVPVPVPVPVPISSPESELLPQLTANPILKLVTATIEPRQISERMGTSSN
jgi:hypothetical protein